MEYCSTNEFLIADFTSYLGILKRVVIQKREVIGTDNARRYMPLSLVMLWLRYAKQQYLFRTRWFYQVLCRKIYCSLCNRAREVAAPAIRVSNHCPQRALDRQICINQLSIFAMQPLINIFRIRYASAKSAVSSNVSLLTSADSVMKHDFNIVDVLWIFTCI